MSIRRQVGSCRRRFEFGDQAGHLGPHRHAARVGEPVRVAGDLGIYPELEAVEHDPAGLDHRRPGGRHRVVDRVDRRLDQQGESRSRRDLHGGRPITAPWMSGSSEPSI